MFDSTAGTKHMSGGKKPKMLTRNASNLELESHRERASIHHDAQ
jgi:hypothetical protein